jgi:hypothetical protein
MLLLPFVAGLSQHFSLLSTSIKRTLDASLKKNSKKLPATLRQEYLARSVFSSATLARTIFGYFVG